MPAGKPELSHTWRWSQGLSIFIYLFIESEWLALDKEEFESGSSKSQSNSWPSWLSLMTLGWFMPSWFELCITYTCKQTYLKTCQINYKQIATICGLRIWHFPLPSPPFSTWTLKNIHISIDLICSCQLEWNWILLGVEIHVRKQKEERPPPRWPPNKPSNSCNSTALRLTASCAKGWISSASPLSCPVLEKINSNHLHIRWLTAICQYENQSKWKLLLKLKQFALPSASSVCEIL